MMMPPSSSSFRVAVVLLVAGISVMLTMSVCAHDTSSVTPCVECALPQGPKSGVQSSADMTFAKGEALNHVTSIKRIITSRLGIPTQALAVKYMRGDSCRDTVVFFNDVRRIVLQGLGIGGATVSTPVLPAREFIHQSPVYDGTMNFLEVCPLIAYAGTPDSSKRNTGFTDAYYGLEVLVAPFGRLLGRQIQLGIAAGVFSENNRQRIPVFAQLRYTVAGALKEEMQTAILPGPCSFRKRDITAITESYEPADARIVDSLLAAGYTELRSNDERDSTVNILTRIGETRGTFRPFLFVEGGPVFNGGFDGSGSSPAVNENDYAQYLLGAGVGLPVFSSFVVQLQYRYMRLNLRTPCPTCPPSPANPNDFFIVNTNSLHSVLLKIGWRPEW